MVPQVFLTFRFIPLFSFYPNPHTILKSSDSQVILRLTGPDSLPEGFVLENEGWEAHLSERGLNHQKEK